MQMNSTKTSIALWIAKIISFILVLDASQSLWIACICLLSTIILTTEVLMTKAIHNLKIDNPNSNDIDAILKKVSSLEQANLPWLLLSYMFFPMLFEIFEILDSFATK